jgi:hypothetical protein
VAGPQGDTLGRGSRFGEMMCRSARLWAALFLVKARGEVLRGIIVAGGLRATVGSAVAGRAAAPGQDGAAV